MGETPTFLGTFSRGGKVEIAGGADGGLGEGFAFGEMCDLPPEQAEFVKAQMREQGAIFAGELSGHLYFRFSENLVADDGTAALIALLDVLATEGRPLAELIDPLRRYAPSGEINSRVADVDFVLDEIANEHASAPEVSRLDGLLVRYPSWWFNLRPSNTEPVLRLNLEADTAEEMEHLRDQMLGRIESLSTGRRAAE